MVRASPRSGKSESPRHWSTVHFEPPQVERNGKDDSTQRVHKMTCGQVAGIASAFKNGLSLTRLELVHDNLGFVPVNRGGARREREEHGFSTRQHLRPVRPFPVLDANQELWLAAAGGNAHDATAALAEDDSVADPAQAGRIGGLTDGPGYPAADGYSFERPFSVSRLSRIERDGLTVGRKNRTRDASTR